MIDLEKKNRTFRLAESRPVGLLPCVYLYSNSINPLSGRGAVKVLRFL